MRSLLRTQPWLDFNPVDPKDREKFEILDEILKAARPALDQVMADLTRDVNPDVGRNPRDVTLFQKALDRQNDIYGHLPKAVAADGGFASAANAEYAKGQGVDKVYFSKSVGRALRKLLPSRAVQRLLFRFRAGVEGVLSSVIRGVGLDRCTWRIWRGFQAYVWAGVIAHNVKMLMETIFRLRRAKLARA